MLGIGDRHLDTGPGGGNRTEQDAQVIELALKAIKPSPFNPRHFYLKSSIAELAVKLELDPVALAVVGVSTILFFGAVPFAGTPLTQTVASQRPSATMLARIKNPSMLRTPQTRCSYQHIKKPWAD